VSEPSRLSRGLRKESIRLAISNCRSSRDSASTLMRVNSDFSSASVFAAPSASSKTWSRHLAESWRAVAERPGSSTVAIRADSSRSWACSRLPWSLAISSRRISKMDSWAIVAVWSSRSSSLMASWVFWHVGHPAAASGAKNPADFPRGSIGHQCPNRVESNANYGYSESAAELPTSPLIPHQTAKSGRLERLQGRSCHAGGRGFESRRFRCRGRAVGSRSNGGRPGRPGSSRSPSGPPSQATRPSP
jgi:hypothetical protein